MLIDHTKDVITEGDFLGTIEPGQVVYFTAAWCPPCRALKPEYGKAAVRDADRTYHLYDVDKVDASVLERYAVQSIPRVFVVEENGIRDITARRADDLTVEVANGSVHGK